MFEPIHGSAFDITGKGIANPVATFWTACQMLEHLGEAQASMRLMKAIEEVCAAGIMTPDVGGSAFWPRLPTPCSPPFADRTRRPFQA